MLSDSLCLGGKGPLVTQQEVTTVAVWLICSMAELGPKDEEVGKNEKAVLGSQSSTTQCGGGVEGLDMLSSRWARAQGPASSLVWLICD